MYVTEIIGDILASDCKRPCKKTTSTMVPGPRTEQRSGHSDVLVMLTQRGAVTTSTPDTWYLLPPTSPTSTCSSFWRAQLGCWRFTARAERRGPCVAVNKGLSTIYVVWFLWQQETRWAFYSITSLHHQKSSRFKKPKYIFSARLTIGVKTNLMLKYHNNCCKMVPICLCWIWRGKSLG